MIKVVCIYIEFVAPRGHKARTIIFLLDGKNEVQRSETTCLSKVSIKARPEPSISSLKLCIGGHQSPLPLPSYHM